MNLQGLSFNKTADLKLQPDEALKLQAGDIVRGQIKGIVGDGLVQLQVRGKLVLAETQIPVQAGQELYLQVDRMENGKLYLRVVDPQVQADLPDMALKGLITKVGLKSDAFTSDIARKLIAYNLPISRENIETVAKMANLLPDSDGRVLETAVFVLSRGQRTATAAQLSSLVEFFNSPAAKAELGQALALVINEYENTGASGKSVNGIGTTTVDKSGAELPGKPDSLIDTTTAKNVAPTPRIPVDKALLAANLTSNGPGKTTSEGEVRSVTLNENQSGRNLGAAANSEQPPQPALGKNDPMVAIKTELDASEGNILPTKAPEDRAGKTTPNPSATITKTGQPDDAAAQTPPVAPGEIADAQTQISKLPINKAQLVIKAMETASRSMDSDNTLPRADDSTASRPTAANNRSPGDATASLLNSAREQADTETSSPMRTGEAVSSKPAADLPLSTKGQPTAGVLPQPAAPEMPPTTTEVKSAMAGLMASSSDPAPGSVPPRDIGLSGRSGPAMVNLVPGQIAEAINTIGNAGDTVTDQLARQIGELIKPALESIITDLDKTRLDGSQIKQLIKEQPSLLPELRLARQVLDQMGSGMQHPLRTAIEQIEQELSGQTLYNRLESVANREQSNYYFTLPLRWQGNIENAELSINWRRDNRSRAAAGDHLTINVGLSTINLGAVVFHVRAQGRQLGLSVYLDNDSAKEQVDQGIKGLMEQLRYLGYETIYMGSQVVDQPPLRPEFIDEDVKENLPPVTGLDLKV